MRALTVWCSKQSGELGKVTIDREFNQQSTLFKLDVLEDLAAHLENAIKQMQLDHSAHLKGECNE